MKNQALTDCEQFIQDSEQIKEKDETLQAINDFEWDYKQFNKRMIELYPEGPHVKSFDISSPQLTDIKRGTKE